MTAPENVIIKEPGPFYDQPSWVEDYYNASVANGTAANVRLAYGPVTDYIRHRHNFPPSAAGVVLTISDPHDPDRGQISGAILDAEQYERFTQFLHSGYRYPDKNNFVLIDDLVATIVRHDLFDNSNHSLDTLYDIVRRAVYSTRPHSGPDDVWTDAIIDRLYDAGFISGNVDRLQVENLFRATFQNHVYGYTPRPEPTSSFASALQTELHS